MRYTILVAALLLATISTAGSSEAGPEAGFYSCGPMTSLHAEPRAGVVFLGLDVRVCVEGNGVYARGTLP